MTEPCKGCKEARDDIRKATRERDLAGLGKALGKAAQVGAGKFFRSLGDTSTGIWPRMPEDK